MPDRPGDMDERDVDARFASIIARWDGPATDDVDAPLNDEPTPTRIAGGNAPADAAGAAGAAPEGSEGSEQPAPGGDATEPSATRTDPAEAAVTDPDVTDPDVTDRDGADRDGAELEGAELDAAELDAAERPAPPVTSRAPWVNPSPFDVVVPASSWRAAEPTDPATTAAAEQAEAALGDEEHFEPPEVVLPPQEDLHFWGAVIGLVAGPLIMLWVVFARPTHSIRWFIVSVLVSLVGFGLLVLRQPKHRDPTSGDNGARV